MLVLRIFIWGLSLFCLVKAIRAVCPGALPKADTKGIERRQKKHFIEINTEENRRLVSASNSRAAFLYLFFACMLFVSGFATF